MTSLTVPKEDANLRLDKFLVKHFPSHSRTYFQDLLIKELIKCNGTLVKKQCKVQEGDEIFICFQLPPLMEVIPEAIALEILYEDDHLLIINKPAGMVVHPAQGSPNQTFANALLYHCQTLQKEEFDPLRPGIVHRLDKDTTGVLVAAKTSFAHKELVEMFAKRAMKKRYLAICGNVPQVTTLSAPIKRDVNRRQQMAIDPAGKEAITHFKILHKKDNLCLLEVEPLTGRTHQIRIHLKHLNCPIIGDATYGSPSLNQKHKVSRQLLHAYSIAFTHPISHREIQVAAPIPLDMKNFIEVIQQA